MALVQGCSSMVQDDTGTLVWRPCMVQVQVCSSVGGIQVCSSVGTSNGTGV
jgi:hypothetical protein